MDDSNYSTWAPNWLMVKWVGLQISHYNCRICFYNAMWMMYIDWCLTM